MSEAVLRELEGRVGAGCAPTEDSLGPAGSMAPGGPSAGASGVPPSTPPTQVWKDGEEEWGFKERTWHLLASWKS